MSEQKKREMRLVPKKKGELGERAFQRNIKRGVRKWGRKKPSKGTGIRG